MTHAPDGPPTNEEWGVEDLDVDAYLQRIGCIGCTGGLAPSAPLLHDLHGAHASSIPFENLDIMLGRTPGLDMPTLQGKLLRRARGGYCYEHNLLFGALLERLGFRVTRLAARVGPPDRLPPKTHMLLMVEAEGRTWLADVGFGAGLRQPMPLEPDVEVSQSGWTYRLRRTDDRLWRLMSREGDAWSDLYHFTLEAQHHVDYVMANHFTATYPSSPFVQRMVAIRTEPDVRHALRGTELVTSRPDGSEESRTVAADEILDVLATVFAIRLEPEEAETVRRRAAPNATSSV
jgi:N-hydroxyarylamine O-acetyltransferase